MAKATPSYVHGKSANSPLYEILQRRLKRSSISSKKNKIETKRAKKLNHVEITSCQATIVRKESCSLSKLGFIGDKNDLKHGSTPSEFIYYK